MDKPEYSEIINFANPICLQQNDQGTVKIPYYLGKGTGPGKKYWCIDCRDKSFSGIEEGQNCDIRYSEEEMGPMVPGTRRVRFYYGRSKSRRSRHSKRRRRRRRSRKSRKLKSGPA